MASLLPQPSQGAALRYADDEGALQALRPARNLGPAPHDELDPLPAGELPSVREHEGTHLRLEERLHRQRLPGDALVVGYQMPATPADLGHPRLDRVVGGAYTPP